MTALDRVLVRRCRGGRGVRYENYSLRTNSLLLTSNDTHVDQSVRLIKPLATLYVALLKRARGVPMWEPLRRLVGGKGEEQWRRRYGGKGVRGICVFI